MSKMRLWVTQIIEKLVTKINDKLQCLNKTNIDDIEEIADIDEMTTRILEVCYGELLAESSCEGLEPEQVASTIIKSNYNIDIGVKIFL